MEHNELITQNQNRHIERLEDDSDELIKRIRIHFKNGYQLSVIFGFGTYGKDENLMEIAIFDWDGEFCPHLFDVEDTDEDVLGYCDKPKVSHYIDKIGRL